MTSILDVMSDPALCGSAFQPVESWAAWRVALSALLGLRLDPDQLEVFQRHTGRSTAPAAPAREGWIIAGRRAGKSRIAALVAVYLACLRDYSTVLAPGERGTLMVIAADRRQARVVFRYILGLLESSPLLEGLIEARGKESVSLTNRVALEVHTASFRAVRGYTLIGAVLDEISFWRTDESAAEPDTEILNAIRPAMATVPGSLLLAISSPYARRGALWQAYSQHFGQDGDPVLVWQAASRDMNSTIPAGLVEDALAADEAAARAEWLAEFRRDIESFVSREVIEAATVPARFELPPVSGVNYVAFVDPSGGSADSMTLAVAHRERERLVLDALREVKPPFSPEQVVSDFAATLKIYGISKVEGDRYAGQWPADEFRKHSITYVASEKSKSEIYTEALPLLNSGKVELLDNKRLAGQLLGLERRTSRSGRDLIDHGPRGQDDIANSAAGALVKAASSSATPYAAPIGVGQHRSPFHSWRWGDWR